jgi:hypothetical protein
LSADFEHDVVGDCVVPGVHADAGELGDESVLHTWFEHVPLPLHANPSGQQLIENVGSKQPVHRPNNVHAEFSLPSADCTLIE